MKRQAKADWIDFIEGGIKRGKIFYYKPKGLNLSKKYFGIDDKDIAKRILEDTVTKTQSLPIETIIEKYRDLLTEQDLDIIKAAAKIKNEKQTNSITTPPLDFNSKPLKYFFGM